jgi:hypothetical protein
MTENILIKNIREILITEMPSDGPLRGSAMSRPGRLPMPG